MTKTTRNILIFGGLAAAVGLVLYLRRQFALLADYDYKITGLKFNKISKNNISVDVKTLIFNKSKIEATVNKIYLELLIQDTKVGFVTESGAWIIPAKGSNEIVMKITFNPQLVLKNIADIVLGGIRQKDVNFTLTGYANVRSGFLSTTIPITYSDKVSAYL